MSSVEYARWIRRNIYAQEFYSLYGELNKIPWELRLVVVSVVVEVFEEREPRKARLALRQGLEDVVLVLIL